MINVNQMVGTGGNDILLSKLLLFPISLWLKNFEFTPFMITTLILEYILLAKPR